MNFQKIGYFSHMLNGWIAYIKIIFFDVKIGKKIIEPKINRKNENSLELPPVPGMTPNEKKGK
mgnify:CR=1 FL=1